MNSVKAFAEKIINTPISLITDKEVAAPSGDKRDLVSLTPYFWLIDGKLVQRDGEVNPATKDYPDPEKLGQVAGNILITSLAAESADTLGDKKRFGSYAISALRAWFVDKKTRMTPSLEYAQMKQGETSGNFWGIIEGVGLIRVAEGVKKLKETGLIDSETVKGLENWFNQYLSWLLTSEKAIGKKDAENERERKGEKGMPNNHATFYDVQVAYIADFLGKSDLARKTIEGVKERIKSQIEPSGEMPEETKRKTERIDVSNDYQIFNLYGFSELALLGQKYDVDLWHWQTEDGRGLKKAFTYFVDQLNKAGDKPFKMDRSGELYFTFRAASLAYRNEDYWELPGKFYLNPLAEEISAEMFNRDQLKKTINL